MTEEVKQRIDKINRGHLPEGYKKTKLGIIPVDWDETKMGKVGRFSKGKGLPGTEMTKIGLPCIGYGDIYTKYNFKFDKTFNFVSQEIADESVPAQKGAVMFTCSGETAIEIGKCVCYTGNETIYVGGDIAIFNAGEKIDPLFLAYQQNIFESIKQKARYSQGHSVVHIYGDNLAKLVVAFPKDVQEQKKIAKILVKWDDIILQQEKLVQKVELQKKAYIQKLLVPGEDWEPIPLKKILKERKTFSAKGFDYTHVTLSKEGVCDKTDQYNRDFLVSSEDKGYKITYFNDLCYNPANLKFGVICLNKYGNAIFSPIYVTFEISKKCNPDFIGEILTSANFVNKIRRFEEGSIYERQAVKPNDFIKDSILVPDIEQQNKIAEICLKLDKKVELEKKKLVHLKKQQNVVRQLLTTGLVRV